MKPGVTHRRGVVDGEAEPCQPSLPGRLRRGQRPLDRRGKRAGAPGREGRRAAGEHRCHRYRLRKRVLHDVGVALGERRLAVSQVELP